MTRKLSVAHLSAIDLAPPAFIEAAGAAGYDAVGLRLIRVTDDTPGYPLMGQAQALRETQSALKRTGLDVSDIEFVRITPDFEIEPLLPFLDTGAELGARHVIAAPYDPDLDRLADRLAELSEAGHARGLSIVLEFFPWTVVPDLATCRQVVEKAGPEVGILVDSLHFDRSGSGFDDLAGLPPSRLPFAHLCDAPVLPAYTSEQLIDTARSDRLPPGQGDIDLHRFLAALPADIPLGT
ncbi:sugar phosphate isomerase/epimerase [Roseibium salinum]|nr:sugar phosphate isomerase/epimerase [Roseibium salinum]